MNCYVFRELIDLVLLMNLAKERIGGKGKDTVLGGMSCALGNARKGGGLYLYSKYWVLFIRQKVFEYIFIKLEIYRDLRNFNYNDTMIF